METTYFFWEKKKADFLFYFSIIFYLLIFSFLSFRTSLSGASPTSPQSSLSNRNQHLETSFRLLVRCFIHEWWTPWRGAHEGLTAQSPLDEGGCVSFLLSQQKKPGLSSGALRPGVDWGNKDGLQLSLKFGQTCVMVIKPRSSF